CVLEQRFCRNTTPDQAGPTERVLLFDHSHPEPELCGANRSHVTAGSGPNHDDIEFAVHFFSDESGTHVVAAAGGRASGGGPASPSSLSPSSRVPRAFS